MSTMPELLTIDVSGWTRLMDVAVYAGVRDISLEEAIKELVNSGLSHWNGKP